MPSHPLISLLNHYGHVPREDADTILAAWQPRTVKEGDVLLKIGTVCREYFFIAHGVLRITKILYYGQQVTHLFLKEEQFCTNLKSFAEQTPATEGIEAAYDTSLMVIGHDELMALNAQFPYLKPLLDEIFNITLIAKSRLRNAYRDHVSMVRYQMFLEVQPEVAARVSLKDVASYLSINPQSLTRIVKELGQ